MAQKVIEASTICEEWSKRKIKRYFLNNLEQIFAPSAAHIARKQQPLRRRGALDDEHEALIDELKSTKKPSMDREEEIMNRRAVGGDLPRQQAAGLPGI